MRNIKLIGSVLNTVKLVGAANTAAPPFDPATLSLTGWWRDFAGLSWSGTASAGNSGSHSLSSVGSDPSVGSLAGNGVAVFDGVTNYITYAAVPTDLFNNSALTWSALIKTNSLPTAGGHAYADATIMCDNTTANLALGVSTSGARVAIDDGAAWNDTPQSAFSNATWTSVQVTYDGATLKCRTNNNTWQTMASGPPSLGGAGNLSIGFNGFGVHFVGSMADIITSNTVLSVANLDNIRSYYNTRYGVSV